MVLLVITERREVETQLWINVNPYDVKINKYISCISMYMSNYPRGYKMQTEAEVRGRL